jgi:hypothetical protein
MSEHELIIGMTRSGKSYHAQAAAQAWPGPVLFYNPQGQKMDVGEWTRATPNDSLSALVSLLSNRPRARVQFTPHWNTEVARPQLARIVDECMQRIWTPPLLIVVDEADQVAPQGKNGTPAHQIAQRGGKQQVWGRFVTQHPSVVSKMVMRQCTRKTIFLTEDSAAYFKQYGWPGDEIERILSTAPKHSYVEWQNRQLTGPFRD